MTPIIAQLEARPHPIERGRTKVRLTRLKPEVFDNADGLVWAVNAQRFERERGQ
jgi:hypothetical protein